MTRLEVVPLVGVGPVRLGMPRHAVHAVLGTVPHEFRKAGDRYPTDCIFDNGFQIFYDGAQPVVEYIELSRDSGFEAYFDSVNVFEVPADELVRRLAQITEFDPDDPELGTSYTFPKWELSLWRPFVPYGPRPFLRSPGNEEGRYFSTIGIGVAGYYSGR
jgi:hypothetical protein